MLSMVSYIPREGECALEPPPAEQQEGSPRSDRNRGDERRHVISARPELRTLFVLLPVRAAKDLRRRRATEVSIPAMPSELTKSVAVVNGRELASKLLWPGSSSPAEEAAARPSLGPTAPQCRRATCSSGT